MYNGVYNEKQFAYMYQTVVKWLNGMVEGERISDRLLELGCKNVAIYGCGELGKLLGRDLLASDVNVLAYIDKKTNAKAVDDNGIKIPVMAPEDIWKLDNDCYVIITPEYYFLEIYDTLKKYNFPTNKILTISMLV